MIENILKRFRSQKPVRSRRTFRPIIEQLEPRCTPTTVTNLGDGPPGSLRDAISTTPAGGVVDFEPGLTGTIVLSGAIPIGKALTIHGPGASIITVSGGGIDRIFYISDSGSSP